MDEMKKILVIIDFQNDFCDTKIGSLASKHAEEACDRFVEYLKEHYKDYDEIFYTLDTHYNDYLHTQEGKKLPVVHCVKGTVGHELRADLRTVIDSIKNDVSVEVKGVEKTQFGAANWNYLLDLSTDNKSQIDIVGCATDICVISNAVVIKAFFKEANVGILEKYCGGIDEEFHNKAVEMLRHLQIDVR